MAGEGGERLKRRGLRFLRVSFGTRLLVFGLVGVWVVIGLIAGSDIVQTQAFWNNQVENFALSDATVAENILQTEASGNAFNDALIANPGPGHEVADLGDPLAHYLSSPAAHRAQDLQRINSILASYGQPPDGSIYVVTPDGATVACAWAPPPGAAQTCSPNVADPLTYAPSGLPSLRAALAGNPQLNTQTQPATPVPLVEDFDATRNVGGTTTPVRFSYDSAMPITQPSSGRVVGAVLYALPLTDEILSGLSKILGGLCTPTPGSSTDASQLGPCLTAALGAQRVFSDFGDRAHAALPGQVARQAAPGSRATDRFSATYQLGNTTYTSFYIPITEQPPPARIGVDNPVVFWLGAERSSQTFEVDRRNDIQNTLLIALFLSVLASILIVAFVRRYVVRPLEVLEGGVSRVAAGDYSRDLPVRGRDEFARLAEHFNHMRQQISEYVAQIDRQRARLGESITSLRGISQALTTTTAGEAELVRAITGAAASMFRTDHALVALDRGSGQTVIAWKGLGSSRPPEAPLDAASQTVAQVLQGEVWQGDFDDQLNQLPRVLRRPGLRGGLWAPMHYQGRVVGSIAVFFRETRVLEPSDIATLTTLANQAAVALENTRLFEQERETVRRLQELDNMKSDFLATVQHELRTPLTAIIGMADLMEMCWLTWKDDQKMEAISDIQVSAKNLDDIVETILDFTLLEARDMGLVGQSFGVARAVFEVIDDLRLKQEKMGVTITVTVPEDLELVADRDRVKQVLKHVLDNAIKFNHPGGSIVVSGGQAKARLWIEVKDTGIGIDASFHERVFDRFFQVDNTATRRYGGTGMGLSLARKIMEAHGGTIEVESSLSGGSAFKLVFPLPQTSTRRRSRAGAPEAGADPTAELLMGGANGHGPEPAAEEDLNARLAAYQQDPGEPSAGTPLGRRAGRGAPRAAKPARTRKPKADGG